MRLRLLNEFIDPETLFGPLHFSSDSFDSFFVNKSIDLLLKETNLEINREIRHISVFENDINWMYDIELSESSLDQNMEIIFNDSKVYFKAIRKIFRNEFLNVFPSKDLEIALGLQYIPLDPTKEYNCKKCSKSFLYQYNLMLHYRYFCSHNINNLLKDLSCSKKIENKAQFIQNNLKRKQSDLNSDTLLVKRSSQKPNAQIESSVQEIVKNCSVNQSLKEYFLFQLNSYISNQTKFNYANSIQKSSVMLSPSISPYQTNCQNEITTSDSKKSFLINPNLIRNSNLPLSINSHGTSMVTTGFVSTPLEKPDLQNWCAKCNTHFRLTSDLVYHMRTFHKKDELNSHLDLNNIRNGSKCVTIERSNREVKFLRCEICNETFKEKHHLTRHLTSHR